MESNDITISQFFKGKTIFITGATGFIGKCLIEKMLRSTPDIEKIYVLVRPKKGKSVGDRIRVLLNEEIFFKVKEINPDNLKKVFPIVGDVSELELGISKEDREKIINEVNIVYHSAASVRFDDPLRDSLILNTRGTREIILLCKQLKKLECFVHISTSYCHIDQDVIGEHFYPPHTDWRSAIFLAENADSHTLDILTEKYKEPLPNTYTFAKGLAEQVVEDLCDGQIPTIVARPSLVISTVDEPIPGWIDNFNGFIGIYALSAKGILRSLHCDRHIVLDCMPVDIIVKQLLISTWTKCVEKNKNEFLNTSVYNLSNNKIDYMTIEEMTKSGKENSWNCPLNNVIWYPNTTVTSSYFLHYFRLVFYQLLPAIIIDALLKLFGKKPMLFKIQRKLFIGTAALHYFMTKEWKFENSKGVSLFEKVLPTDKIDYAIPLQVDKNELSLNVLRGIRKYLLREDDTSFESAKRHIRRLWVLSIIWNILFYVCLFYLIVVKFNFF